MKKFSIKIGRFSFTVKAENRIEALKEALCLYADAQRLKISLEEIKEKI